MSDTVLAASAAVAIMLAIVLTLTRRHHDAPARVEPVPHASTAAQEARNLEAWLKRYSK